MNDRFDLRIITQPHSQVYWGYFRRLVFGNSSTKHNKLTYFSNSMLFCSDVLLPFSHIPHCIHAKTPDFPRLFEPRESKTIHCSMGGWVNFNQLLVINQLTCNGMLFYSFERQQPGTLFIVTPNCLHQSSMVM